MRTRARNQGSEAARNGVNGDSEEPQYEEDLISDEGAVWPIQLGRIVNWSCFFGLIQHIYQTMNPPFHTPILLIAEPAWTIRDHERITQFFFEKFRTPGFAIMDAAQATCYAFGIPTACIVDIGKDKANVTAITEFLTNSVGRAVGVEKCAGEAMTQRLLELLAGKGFTREMCEQLKASSICEILPPGTPLPGSNNKVTEDVVAANPAAAASTGAEDSGPNQRHTAGALGQAPRGPGQDTEVGAEDTAQEAEQDGVLDVASIVAGGKMNEYLAKKEKEKAEKAAHRKKGQEAAAAAAKPVRLKNSEKDKASFLFEDHALHDALKGTDMSTDNLADAKAALDEGPRKPNGTDPEPTSPIFPKESSSQAPRREITVGTERFLAASNGLLDTLTTTIHRVILSVPDPAQRPDLWNNIVIVGNGAAVRGFREALLATLNERYLVSPSSATIFTSELPSNMSTPLATGANTPVPQHHGGGQLGFGNSQHGGVNPLLIAATTASAQSASGHLAPPSAMLGHGSSNLTPNNLNPQSAAGHAHSSHAQTPTSIKLAQLPGYFPEWKDVGSAEAVFLGAQVAARMLFVVDSGGVGKGWMSRGEYNEQGPSGISDYSL